MLERKGVSSKYFLYKHWKPVELIKYDDGFRTGHVTFIILQQKTLGLDAVLKFSSKVSLVRAGKPYFIFSGANTIKFE